MKQQISLKAFLSILSFCFAGSTLADAKHGIAMYGEPDLPQDFVSLPYVNLDAPQGGRLVFGERGSFDSFNPFILKGKAPYNNDQMPNIFLCTTSIPHKVLFGLQYNWTSH